MNQDNQIQLNELNSEIKSLLKTFISYEFVPGIIEIKLNAAGTLLCLNFNNYKKEIENDSQVIDENTYNIVRTRLQYKRYIPENKWDASFKLAKSQCLTYLIKKNKLEDQKGFLKEFHQFIKKLPEISEEYNDCCRRLMEINFDDWDIEESEENDSRLKTFKEIHEQMVKCFNRYNTIGKDYIKLKNSTSTEIYSEEEDKLIDNTLPFETKYPKQSKNIKRIFEILNALERGEELDRQIGIIAGKLSLSEAMLKKLKGYFNASIITKPQKTIKIKENNHWYTDEDMKSYCRVLEKHCVNFDSQFSNTLTEDNNETLPSIESLINNHPIYICFNTGRRANNDNSIIHWVAIVIVKREERVTILYKDSKKDWNNSSNNVESLFTEHYKNRVDFIRNLQAEQDDDDSCGPMTINNLEIMALIVKEANDKGNDGIAELIRLFKGECGGIDFTTQNQVRSIRISHLLQKKSYSKANLKQDTNIDDLKSIITKLELCDNDISMKDGKNFNLVTIKGDGNCFYSAVADQLRTLDIKKIKNEAYNQPETYYGHQDLRTLALEYINNNRLYNNNKINIKNKKKQKKTNKKKNKKNGKQKFGKDPEERLKAQTTELLPSNIHTIDQYKAFNGEEGTLVDSGIIGALAQALNVTLSIYHQDGMPRIYNSTQDADTTVKKIVYLQYTGNHYNCLVDVDKEDTIIKEKEEIQSYIHKINKYYDQFKDWREVKLLNWSKEHKGQLSKNFGDSTESVNKICEAIAIMDRANELATGGHRFRDTQKVSILIFIQTNTKGHISQINTGEGKTTIVSVVEALKVMQGYKCHVITSNNVLAADGVKEKQLFYDLLNISTADNNPNDNCTDGPRTCYSKDIVYGSITSFQFDWLRDSFEQLNTLGCIDFNNIWVMLDEIDSLLIDQGSNIAKLSGPFPGMENLRYVYINIWVALGKVEGLVIQQILEKLKEKFDELDKKDFKTKEDEKEIEEYEDSLRESFLDEIKKMIKNQKDHLINKKVLANHLHQYAEDSLERWIDLAFTAKYQYKENVEYKIAEDKNGENIIIPLDNQNTGVSMKNTILSNGLHQFLQIKHNLCLTYESLTSCYVSNLDYIKKYGSKLSGVTGTLGSKPERDLLRSVFNLRFSVIPPFKPKQFLQFPGKISVDDEFVNDVAIAALGELTRTYKENQYFEDEQPVEISEIKIPRAVLIVCTSILDAEIIAIEIDREAKAAGLSPKILKYVDETDVLDITANILDICHIVIATNLAGRGTDFKTSVELENNGGLHVIEAFLPCNKRVEDQGLGRTGRQGNKGTGQIIVRRCEVESLGFTANNTENIDFDEIINRRDELETMRINDIADKKITELEFKGHLFNKFSSQYGSLKEQHKIGTDVIQWIYVLRDLKEKWAFWLDKQAYTAESIKTMITKQKSLFTKRDEQLLKAVDEEYNKFIKEAKPIINGTISHNPFYSICLAETYLEKSTDKSNREKAKSQLEHALKNSGSSELLYSAYIKLFEIAIEDGGQLLKRFKKAVGKIFFFPLESGCPDYKKYAFENLQKAAIALAIEHDYLKELFERKTTIEQQEESVLASIVFNGEENHLIKHLQARLTCLGVYKGNIESLIKQINGEEILKNSKDKDLIGPNDDIILDSKVPRYLSKLGSQNELKKYITDRSVDELEYVGMSSVYQLRKIHDVDQGVINSSQILIGSGFAFIVSAMVFPVLLPVSGLANSMVSEGITNIITALIQQGQSKFNKKDYIKAKVISYSLSILTMGIGELMNSTKILNKAVNVCRSLATKLRDVEGPFAEVCKYIAEHLDNIAVYLKAMIEKIELAGNTANNLIELKDANELQQFQKPFKVLELGITDDQQKQIVMQSFNAVKGVAKKKILTMLNNLISSLQPIIQEKVFKAVTNKINCELKKGTFNNVSELEIKHAIKKLTSLKQDNKYIKGLEKIARRLLKKLDSWKITGTLALECILSASDIATYTNKICDKFIANLPKVQANNNDSDQTEIIKKIITNISEKLSSILYDKIYAITEKLVVTLPTVFTEYKTRQEQKAEEKAIADMRHSLNQIDIADYVAEAANTYAAVSETLGLHNYKGSKQLADATNLSGDISNIQDVEQLYKENGLEVTSCDIEDALSQFEKQNSDRAVVYLSNDKGFDHVMAVTINKKDNCPMVTENGQKINLGQYKQIKGFTNAKFIIPKDVNCSTLPDIQHKCNLNRIVRATHPIYYVGEERKKNRGNSSINF